MIIIAMTLYLPQHLAFLTNRAWFYYNGEESARAAVQPMLESATTTILLEKVKETLAAHAGSVGAASVVSDAGREL
jgi:hypothetical protein